ncbi:MAG: SDR family oxidoreductase [Gammaproteobacteria bacterium]|nr:SDR family oxidoreductase [Gammaproteobacteria bacterium]MDH5801060.1 SDR family oxidoreductase [Gammaproteobacteria bacterium]
METSTQRQTLVITGASSGIGAAVAQRQIQEGYSVIGLGRHCESREHFDAVAVDFSRLEAVEQGALDIARSESAGQICALVCCAGVGRFGGLEEFSLKQMQEIMHVNFMAHAVLLKHLLPVLKRRQQGHLVVIGSESALNGGKNGALYCASKFALRGLVQSLRAECSAANVNVTLINPGMVRSPFFENLAFEPGDHPDNYILPEDVAHTVAMVLSMRQHTVVDEINMSPLKKVVKKKS